MNTYYMMQMQKPQGSQTEPQNQIMLVDVSTKTGINQYRGLTTIGAKCIGCIMSDKTAHALMAGFNAEKERRISELEENNAGNASMLEILRIVKNDRR